MSIKNFFSLAALSLMAAATLTSCEDILGHWERPGTVTPTPSEAETIPEGAICGKFSVADGKQVYFSKGNLQLTAADTWQFAENQWDYFGASQSDDHRDLFGWGTGNNPNQTSTDNIDYSSFTDWGDNTSLQASLGTGWRTLTKDEWVYLFGTRTVNGGTSEGKSYTLGQKVNEKLGIVIYPDDYTGGAYTTGSDWSEFESAGCVFLPAAGNRSGTSVYGFGSNGSYWSSSPNSSYADYVYFSSSYLGPDNSYRYYGYSVRLVRDVAAE